MSKKCYYTYKSRTQKANSKFYGLSQINLLSQHEICKCNNANAIWLLVCCVCLWHFLLILTFCTQKKAKKKKFKLLNCCLICYRHAHSGLEDISVTGDPSENLISMWYFVTDLFIVQIKLTYFSYVFFLDAKAFCITLSMINKHLS